MKNITGEEQKKIFAKNLKYWLGAKKMMQKELAARSGLTPNAITEYLHCRTYPSPSAMQRIADALGLYMSDLREPMNAPGQVKKAVAIPVLGSVPAGIPIAEIEDIIDWEEIPEHMARTGQFFALRVKGSSMEPKISDGDVVIVRQQETVENGEIAIVRINGDEATMKRFYRSGAGVQLVGTNPAFSPLIYTPEQVEALPVRVLGKVVELRAKF